MIITLRDIEEQQSKLADMIEQFKAQAKQPTEIHFPEMLIELNDNEHYAGIITSKDGEASYHLILLPGQADNINWEDAKKWAEEAGGHLPTRREQALLYANLKEQFEERWHWSCEAYASGSDYAWCQHFTNGSQDYNYVGYELCARAVRRLVIEAK